jgi:phosphatidylglycerophosphatase A
MDKIALAIATGMYAGYLPRFPGTWGTLVAIPIHFLIIMLIPLYYYGAMAAIFIIAVITAGMAEKIIDTQDPKVVVIDEIIGMLIVLIGAPLTLPTFFTAFCLFRFFDILKPFPVGWIDKHLHGGTGIVLDDIMAGLYALGCLNICYYLGWL